MKKTIILLMMAFFMPLIANAYDVEIDGIYYNVVKKTKQARVVIGEKSYSSMSNIVIPASIEYNGVTCDVVAIEEFGRASYNSITIPSSITSISGIFTSFTSDYFENVYISDLAAWCNITFSCKPLDGAKHLFLNNQEVTDMVIPSGVTTIPPYAFKGCQSILSVEMPQTLISIGNDAFMDCSNLKSITFPSSSLTSIGAWAFTWTALESVTIPNSVKEIGELSFWGCSHLTSATLPNQLTKIPGGLFGWCTNLSSITIPNSVTIIDSYYSGGNYDGAFMNCKKLKSIIIPNSVTSIGAGTFEGCTGITDITIPNSLQTIGRYAFENCSALENVYIDNLAAWCMIDNQSTPLAYAKHLFLNNQEIKDLVVPDGLTKLNGFNGFSGLTSLTIPNTCALQNMGNFSGCTNLQKVVIGKNIESSINLSNCPELTDVYCYTLDVLSGKFNNSYAEYATLHVNEDLLSIYKEAEGWKTFGTITAIKPGDPGYVKPSGDIIEFADKTMKKLCVKRWDTNGDLLLSKEEAETVKNVERFVNQIGREVKSFDEFQYFTGITSIEASTFYFFLNMISVIIPCNVNSIGNAAFQSNESLERVILPQYLTSIGQSAFSGSYSLKDVYCYATECPQLQSLSFASPKNATLHVPANSIELYKKAYYWRNFGNIIALEDGDPGYANIQPVLPGDLTGDAEVDGMDLVALVNVIMGTSVQTGGADLNGDGEVDGMDYVTMVNIIMGTAGSRSTDAAAARAMEQDTHHVTIDMEPLTIAPGESRELTITLQNADMDVTMVQADLTLPQGLTLTGEYVLGNRTTERNHQLYMSGQNGQHRLMLASPQNALLSGTEGAVVRLTLTADDSFQSGDIVLSNMLCASPTLQAARQQQAVLRLSGTDGITDISATGQAAGKNVYTLSGQRMAAPRKGVNIIGGKKVIIK